MDKTLIKDYAWAIRGRQRRAILHVLNKPKTPAQIHEEAKKINPKLSLNNVSDILRAFAQRQLAICLNPEEKVGRLYKLTPHGEAIRQEFMK